MPAAFVKSLLTGFNNGTSPNCLLNQPSSKTITLGNTIFVAYSGTIPMDPLPTVTDNLGNAYTYVGSAAGQGGNHIVHLFRANITNAGALSTITCNHPNWPTVSGISAEFSGVGAIRGSVGVSGTTGGQTSVANAVPGGASTATQAYAAGDLWIGGFGQGSNNTFATDTGSNAVAALEPAAEVFGSSVVTSMLYYVGASPLAAGRLAGRWAGSSYTAGVGAAFQPAVVAIVYNDAPTGAIVFTGSRTESWQRGIIRSDAPTGSLALGGSVVESGFVRKIYNDAPTGALVFTGSVVEYIGKGFTDARTGTLPLFGTRTEQLLRADAPTGRAALNGTAAEAWFIHQGYTDAPTGAIGIAGTSTEVRRADDRPSGRISIGGTIAAESNRRTEAITGRIRSYGWAAEPVPPSTPRPVGIPGDVVMSAGDVANPTILRPPTGTGYEIGDVLICIAVGGGTAILNTGAVTPGWTVGSTPLHLYLVGKVAESLAEPPPVLTFQTIPGGSGTPVAARIVAFRGLDTSNMAAIADVVGSANTLSSAGASAGGEAITTIYDNDLVLSLTKRDIGPTVTRFNPPAGFGLVTWDMINSGERMSIAWAYQVKRPAGVVAAPVFGVSTPDGTVRETTGVAVALKATAVEEHYSTPSGTFLLTGTRVERKIYTDKPTGKITVAGAVAAESHVQRPKPTGVLTLSGTVQEAWSHVGTATGSIALSGSAADTGRYVDAVAATIAVTGTVEERYRLNNFDTCSGVLRLAGVLAQDLVLHDGPDGRLKLAGTRSEFITIDDAVFYDDFPAGGFKINGRLVFLSEIVIPGRGGRLVFPLEPGRIVRSLEPGRVTTNLTGRVRS